MLTHINLFYKQHLIIFTKTLTTGEICAGVVKATGLYHKNPTQHYADLNML